MIIQRYWIYMGKMHINTILRGDEIWKNIDIILITPAAHGELYNCFLKTRVIPNWDQFNFFISYGISSALGSIKSWHSTTHTQTVHIHNLYKIKLLKWDYVAENKFVKKIWPQDCDDGIYFSLNYPITILQCFAFYVLWLISSYVKCILHKDKIITYNRCLLLKMFRKIEGCAFSKITTPVRRVGSTPTCILAYRNTQDAYEYSVEFNAKVLQMYLSSKL